MASLSPRLQFRVKKEGWGGGGTRNVTFVRGQGDVAALKAGGKTLTVSIGDGLPRNASECQGARGGWWEEGGTGRTLGAAGHSWRPGDIGESQHVPQCPKCLSPGGTHFCWGDGAEQGVLGKKGSWVQIVGAASPPQPALRTNT